MSTKQTIHNIQHIGNWEDYKLVAKALREQYKLLIELESLGQIKPRKK